MKEKVMMLLTNPITWIVAELIVIAILIFLVRKYSRRKNELEQALESSMQSQQYKDLDERIANRKRSER